MWGWAGRRATEELLWGISAALNTLIPIQDTLKMQCGLKALPEQLASNCRLCAITLSCNEVGSSQALLPTSH